MLLKRGASNVGVSLVEQAVRMNTAAVMVMDSQILKGAFIFNLNLKGYKRSGVNKVLNDR